MISIYMLAQTILTVLQLMVWYHPKVNIILMSVLTTNDYAYR